MEKDGKIIGQNVFVRAQIEKMLLDYSLEKAAEMGVGAVLIEGNIAFYGKSGFDYAKKFGISYNDLEKDADTPFFLCKELKIGYLRNAHGVYRTPKEKLKLAGQIF